MCGIAGVVWRDQPEAGTAVNRAAFARIVRGLAHRGPDAEGICHRTRFSFGHRRLNIVDLNERANQPMSDRRGRVYVTFNGEIYNHRALRQRLQRAGCAFQTESDTEVIVQGYRCWGQRVVDHLDGMFAFGLFDEETNEFFLARDRIGVKPVFFFLSEDALYFASELKGVIAHADVPRRLNPHAVSSFLSYRQVLGTQTYFDGVQALEPGCVLRVMRGAVDLQRYWQIDTDRSKRESPKLNTIAQLISQSVAQQSAADVPVAAFLSGGLDSSILLYELTRQRTAGLRCITAQFEQSAYDETPFAREVAARFGALWQTAAIRASDQFDAMRALIRVKDQPLGMHNEVAMYTLAQHIKPHAPVVICGEGADEVFCGYGRIFRAPFDYRRMQWLRRLPSALGARVSRVIGLERRDFASSELEFFLRRYQYFPQAEKFALYQPQFARAVDGDVYTRDIVAGLFNAHAELAFSDRIWLFFVQHHLPGLLAMVDAATMAVGLEARVPFTDHRLVQAGFDLPFSQKLTWRSTLQHARAATLRIEQLSERCDETKSVLRRIYADKLPAAVLQRPKMGFPVPLGQWLTTAHWAHVRSLLLKPNARLHALFDPKRLAAWLERGVQHTDDTFGRKLWMLCNLEIFLQEYF